MKYSVDFAVRGYYAVDVEADSIDEAVEKASKKINEVNFGRLEDATFEDIDVSVG